jgi:Fe2+ or Zn2+ uptake regulation protein
MSTAPIVADPAALRAELQAAGLKVTTPRLAVLEALATQPHADADAVFQRVRKDLPTTSVQAVYGVLGALTDAGILRRIEPAGSSALYERRTGDNHHHLICRSCRAVLDVDCAIGEAPCLTPSQSHGFAVDQAEVTFWGLCPTCQNGRQSTSTEGE